MLERLEDISIAEKVLCQKCSQIGPYYDRKYEAADGNLWSREVIFDSLEERGRFYRELLNGKIAAIIPAEETFIDWDTNFDYQFGNVFLAAEIENEYDNMYFLFVDEERMTDKIKVLSVQCPDAIKKHFIGKKGQTAQKIVTVINSREFKLERIYFV